MLKSDGEPNEDSDDLELDFDFKGEAIFVWKNKCNFIQIKSNQISWQKCLTVEKAL